MRLGGDAAGPGGDESDPHTALALLQDAIRIDPSNDDLQRRARQAYARTTGSVPKRRPADQS